MSVGTIKTTRYTLLRAAATNLPLEEWLVHLDPPEIDVQRTIG